jgi:hypothetical protein
VKKQSPSANDRTKSNAPLHLRLCSGALRASHRSRRSCGKQRKLIEINFCLVPPSLSLRGGTTSKTNVAKNITGDANQEYLYEYQ